MTIDSLTNAQVKYWVSLHQTKNRQEAGQFLVEGDHLVEEAVSENAVDLILLSMGRENPYPEIKSVVLSDKVFSKVSRLESLGSIMAVCHLSQRETHNPQRIIICDRIQDPGNLGTIIRTSTAFGFDKIICSLDCVDYTNEKVIRSTQGALFHIELVQMDLARAINDLKKSGVSVVGTTLEDAISLTDVKRQFPMALVLGNEGAGVSKEILDLCDQKIKIESSSFESLNVAIAAGILCHHFRK
ncbi:MAG: RNA methyltransferase [Erysipelotrichaceae bacterium]|nr:RNA methyltransferase [Erysipelotrichaceae bacterium]